MTSFGLFMTFQSANCLIYLTRSLPPEISRGKLHTELMSELMVRGGFGRGVPRGG